MILIVLLRNVFTVSGGVSGFHKAVCAMCFAIASVWVGFCVTVVCVLGWTQRNAEVQSVKITGMVTVYATEKPATCLCTVCYPLIENNV